MQTFRIEFLKINGEIEVLPDKKIELADDISVRIKKSGHIESNGNEHYIIDSITITLKGISQSETLARAKNRLYQILSYLAAKTGCKLAISRPIEYQFHYSDNRRTLPSQDLQLFHKSYPIRACLKENFSMSQYQILPQNLKHALHFYQAAMDDTNPDDYRLLNFWRFFEAYSNTSQKNNIIKNILTIYKTISSDLNHITEYPHVMNQKNLKEILELIYDAYRCPVAHFRSKIPGILPNFNDARVVEGEYRSRIRIMLMFLEDLSREIAKKTFS